MRLSEEGEVADLWQTGQNEKCTDGPVHISALCALDWDMCSQVCKEAGSWCMGTGERAQSENCCWLWGDGPRGQEGGNLQQGMLMEADRTAVEARTIAESHAGGGAAIAASLSPHAGACQRKYKKPAQGWLLCASCRAIKKNSLRAGPHTLAARQ